MKQSLYFTIMVDSLSALLELMSRLRAPDGCPWDIEQTFASIAPHTIEEAYEVADAIEREDMANLKDELGDLLFQVVFHAQIAKEQNAFDFQEIAAHITQKMRRRHPHVFAHQTGIDNAADQLANWETLKEQERKTKAQTHRHGALADVSTALPALMRAHKLQKRAARVGFDWPDVAPVFDKFREETAELEVEVENANPQGLDHEVGDILFTCVNLARKLNIDPETALRHANRRFENRFAHIEKSLWDSGRDVADVDLNELDKLWDCAKKQEANPEQGQE